MNLIKFIFLIQQFEIFAISKKDRKSFWVFAAWANSKFNLSIDQFECQNVVVKTQLLAGKIVVHSKWNKGELIFSNTACNILENLACIGHRYNLIIDPSLHWNRYQDLFIAVFFSACKRDKCFYISWWQEPYQLIEILNISHTIW